MSLSSSHGRVVGVIFPLGLNKKIIIEGASLVYKSKYKKNLMFLTFKFSRQIVEYQSFL